MHEYLNTYHIIDALHFVSFDWAIFIFHIHIKFDRNLQTKSYDVFIYSSYKYILMENIILFCYNITLVLKYRLDYKM